MAGIRKIYEKESESVNTVIVVGLGAMHALIGELLALSIGHTMASLVSYYRVPNDETANLFVRATMALLHLPFKPRRVPVLCHRLPVSV